MGQEGISRVMGFVMIAAGVVAIAHSIWILANPDWRRRKFFRTHPVLAQLLRQPLFPPYRPERGHRRSARQERLEAVAVIALGVFAILFGLAELVGEAR